SSQRGSWSRLPLIALAASIAAFGCGGEEADSRGSMAPADIVPSDEGTAPVTPAASAAPADMLAGTPGGGEAPDTNVSLIPTEPAPTDATEAPPPVEPPPPVP